MEGKHAKPRERWAWWVSQLVFTVCVLVVVTLVLTVLAVYVGGEAVKWCCVP